MCTAITSIPYSITVPGSYRLVFSLTLPYWLFPASVPPT